MFDVLVEKLKAQPRKIVFTEGTDARILEAAARLKDTNAILRAVLKEYGFSQSDLLDLFKHFEYVSVKDFDENGQYVMKEVIEYGPNNEILHTYYVPLLETVSAHTEKVTDSLKRATWQSFGIHLGVKYAF